MRRLRRATLFAIGLMAVAFIANVGAAFADTIEVRIINAAGGGDTGWIVCASTMCSTGTITVGNYSIASNIAISSNGVNPFLDLSYVTHTSIENAGSIIFEAIANGFTVPAAATFLVGNGNSTLGDQISVAAYGGNNNTPCPAGVNGCSASTNGAFLESVGPLTIAQSASYSQSAAGGGNIVNPYELGIQVTLNNPTNAGGASGDIEIINAPEPGSLTLLGGRLLALAGGLRRTIRKG